MFSWYMSTLFSTFSIVLAADFLARTSFLPPVSRFLFFACSLSSPWEISSWTVTTSNRWVISNRVVHLRRQRLRYFYLSNEKWRGKSDVVDQKLHVCIWKIALQCHSIFFSSIYTGTTEFIRCRYCELMFCLMKNGEETVKSWIKRGNNHIRINSQQPNMLLKHLTAIFTRGDQQQQCIYSIIYSKHHYNFLSSLWI